jgi:hypothetical protein
MQYWIVKIMSLLQLPVILAGRHLQSPTRRGENVRKSNTATGQFIQQLEIKCFLTTISSVAKPDRHTMPPGLQIGKKAKQ